MNQWASFGDKARFEIAVRWSEDEESRDLRPMHGGWSTGKLRLTVAHHVLTRNEFAGSNSDSVKWYLLPIFEWMAKQWVPLLHEERFAWRENSAAPAATAVFLALRRMIDASDDAGEEDFENIQSWWLRHALRAADASALYPDVVFRRLRDEIEISWTARQPIHSPDGFRFDLMPGVAIMPISDVAGPLWEALNWVGASAKVRLSSEDNKSVIALQKQISKLKNLPSSTLEAGYLPKKLFAELSTIREKVHFKDKSVRLNKVPAIKKLDDAVLMFGGVSPDIGVRDVQTLLGLLSSSAGGHEGPELKSLVDETIGAPLSAPFQEGYDLAEQLLEVYSLPDGEAFVDVRSLLRKLKVGVVERVLNTSTIRGIAIAGTGYAPKIVINKTSEYNLTESGKRFTLAHELFHLLYDRTRARRITHVSGPWAPPSVEKRANAFAAMFLMPRTLLSRTAADGPIDNQAIIAAAESMQVSASALVEHLYNTSMIDEATRDQLRVLSAIVDKGPISYGH